MRCEHRAILLFIPHGSITFGLSHSAHCEHLKDGLQSRQFDPRTKGEGRMFMVGWTVVVDMSRKPCYVIRRQGKTRHAITAPMMQLDLRAIPNIRLDRIT